VTGIALHLRGEVRDLWFEWLRTHRPDLLPRYERLYQRGAYMQTDERTRLAALVKGPDEPPDQRMRGRVVRRGAGKSAQEEDSDRPPVKQNGQQRLF
jgi:hypothetical protein